MKTFIFVCLLLIIMFLFNGCTTIYIIIPPDKVIIDNSIQLPIPDPPAPPWHPVGPPIIIVPIPNPTPVTYPPAVIIAQPEPVDVIQDRREICVGRGPADQKPEAPIMDHRESHSGRNPIVSNPPSQTYYEQSGSRNDGRENTQRPARDAGVKRNTR